MGFFLPKQDRKNGKPVFVLLQCVFSWFSCVTVTMFCQVFFLPEKFGDRVQDNSSKVSTNTVATKLAAEFY